MILRCQRARHHSRSEGQPLTDGVAALDLLLRQRQVVPPCLSVLRLDCAPHDAQLARDVVDGRMPQLRGDTSRRDETLWFFRDVCVMELRRPRKEAREVLEARAALPTFRRTKR